MRGWEKKSSFRQSRTAGAPKLGLHYVKMIIISVSPSSSFFFFLSFFFPPSKNIVICIIWRWMSRMEGRSYDPAQMSDSQRRPDCWRRSLLEKGSLTTSDGPVMRRSLLIWSNTSESDGTSALLLPSLSPTPLVVEAATTLRQQQPHTHSCCPHPAESFGHSYTLHFLAFIYFLHTNNVHVILGVQKVSFFFSLVLFFSLASSF